MQLKEIKKSGKYHFNGKIINLRVDDIILPNGKESKREVVEHNGGSCLLVEKNDKILFVKQFRYPVGKPLLEIPAGKIDKGEDPLTTAIRELEEECGLIPLKIEKLFEFYPSPGYANEKLYIYQVKEFKRAKKSPDEDEFLEVKWIKTEKVRELIQKGKIEDAKTLIALLNYFLIKAEKERV